MSPVKRVCWELKNSIDTKSGDSNGTGCKNKGYGRMCQIPETDGGRNKNEIGFIFFLGAKVQTIAYVPFLNELSKNGITCILVDMPLHMAIFNSSAAKYCN